MDRVARTGSDKAGAGRSGRRLGSLAAAVALAVGVGISASAHAANIVVNGGFETGDFTGWTQTGNTGFNGVECPGPGLALEGSCDAFFGPVGSLGGVSQNLPTLVGRFYTISFDWSADGGTPSEFTASWGGTTIVDLINPSAGTRFPTISRLATTPITTLSFSFRDDPGFMFLDSVSAAVPEPASVALLGIGLAGLWAGRRRKAQ